MSQSFTRSATLSLLVSAFAAGGCDWRAFQEYEDSAPIRAFDAPKSYRLPGYGNVLTSFQHGDKGLVVSSAGANSPVMFQRMWNGRQVSDEAITRCKREEDCKEAAGLGETLIPFPVWAHGTPQEKTGCILSPATPKAFVFCDSNSISNQSFTLDLGSEAAAQSSMRFSGVGLPAGHRLGVAILGAYALSNVSRVPSAGRLFYQPDFQPPGQPRDEDEVPLLQPLPLRDPVSGEPFADLPDSGDLGYAIAAAENGAGELVIAISQPAHERVIVATYHEALPGGIEDKLRTRACLQSPSPGLNGFGKRLLVGDVNADGSPEIFVGIDPTDGESREQGAQTLFLYHGTGLPAHEEALTDCPPFAAPPDGVECPGGPAADDVRCEGSDFGAALALGDVDGDGVHDLLVGAPYADVRGAKEAGAVWVIPGQPSGGLALGRATALFVAGQARAHLGMAVTSLHTKDRDEPVAGAPGANRLFAFMCSQLEDDVSKKSLCLPK